MSAVRVGGCGLGVSPSGATAEPGGSSVTRIQAPSAAKTSSWEAVRVGGCGLGVSPSRATAVRAASWGHACVEELPWRCRLTSRQTFQENALDF